MIPKNVVNYLNKLKSRFEPVAHRTVYTAFDAAQTMHVKLNQVVKSLMIKADREYFLVSLPADKNLDLAALKKALKQHGAAVKKISFPNEREITRVFRIKPGQLTGFAPLHNVKAIIDTDLKKAREVVVSAGSLTDSVRMKVVDYVAALEHALVAKVGKRRPAPKQRAAKKR